MLRNFKKVRRFWSASESNSSSKPPVNEQARFGLGYESLHIGTLKLENGIWEFQYTEEFKAQVKVSNGIKPLLAFPDVEKTYKSEELWEAFAVRIPSLQQPAIQRIIEEEQLDKDNEVALLRRFGSETVSSPFVLSAQ
jgi:HipA-like protein